VKVPPRGKTIVREPLGKTPVSNAPVSDVAEWLIPSAFVHVTESPAFTVTDDGWNAKFLMVTAALAASAGSGTAAAVMTSAITATGHARSAAAIRSHTMPRAAPFVALGRDAARLGLHLSDAQLDACSRYAEELAEATKAVNLTAITEIEDIAVKHFLDSFTAYAARTWSGHERVVDVGSGAGFPGLALQIALPGLSVTCVEATGKKARAIETFRDLLHLERAEVENARAEDLVRTSTHRERYEVATARALGSLAHCVELLFPFLRVGGDAIVWKGRVDAEMRPAERALAAIGGQLVTVVSTASLGLGEQLPGRSLVVLRKERATAESYPRTPAEMKRRPW
jgi:16S rRNA (guanine527-N7)-methyltransferase